MISQLITYLAGLPTATTSPLYVALNVPELVEAMGEATEIKVIDTRTSEMNPPYCRLYDASEVIRHQDFCAGGIRSYMEQVVMQVECAAYGPSVSIASMRAEYLKLAVEANLQSLIKEYLNNDLAKVTDLTGTGSKDEIKQFQILGSKPTSPPMGPGTETAEHWTATKNLRVELWVYSSRLIAA